MNDTWLYDYNPYCDDSIIFDDTICLVRRGNWFYKNDSSTYDKYTDILDCGGAVETYLDGSEDVSGLPYTSLGGVDTFAPGTTNLTNYPIGIPRENWDHGYTILHVMGMGSNSTYLQALIETGQIASRVWSIFWGRMWVSNRIDGNVVVGGYDENKVIGKNYTQPLDYTNYTDTGCWTGMKVNITDIQVITRTGVTTSIFGDIGTLSVCIVPQRHLLLEGPASIREQFESVTGMETTGLSYGLHWGASLYNDTNVFDGDMQITLSSGLLIRVPNDQYLVPFVTIERNGSRTFNTAQREFLFGSIGTQPPTLGRYFLTAAYLMVNHDAGTFTLWEANPSSDISLMPVVTDEKLAAADSTACASVSAVVQTSAAVTGASPGASSGSSSTPASETQKPAALPGGAIAGIAVGGAAVLVAAILGFVLIRRRRASLPTSTQVPDAGLQPVDGENSGSGSEGKNTSIIGPPPVYEVHEASRPQELQGSRMVYEMDGTEAETGVRNP